MNCDEDVVMIKLRPILLVNGILLMVVAFAMLVPAFVDMMHDDEDKIVFQRSFFITLFVGGALFFTNRGFKGKLEIRDAFILTASSWIITPFFAALPLYFSDLGLNYTNALFEATSGLTTTGATVLTNLDNMHPGILLWRAILQWLGGIGIIVLAMAVLPMLQIGGMQLFRTESSDKSDKILPRADQIAAVIGSIYLTFTGLCALLLWMFGMSGLDAICHAMSTIATAGFSTHDASIGYFNSAAIEYIILIFMVMSALPYVLYYYFSKGNYDALLNDDQVRWFIGLTLSAIAFVTLWLFISKEWDIVTSFRYASFNVTSIITTTGFTSTDYSLWGPFAVIFFFMASVVGGCTGSTTGGIKVFRYKVLFETAKAQIFQLIQPHGVFRPRYNRKTIPPAISSAVLSFFILFAFCFLALAMALSLFGLDYVTSMSAAASMLANLGPALGDIIGPSGTFAPLPDGAKWLLMIGMIMGRLELFTIIVILSPRFWRD